MQTGETYAIPTVTPRQKFATLCNLVLTNILCPNRPGIKYFLETVSRNIAFFMPLTFHALLTS